MTVTDNCSHPQCHSMRAQCTAATKIKESPAFLDSNDVQKVILSALKSPIFFFNESLQVDRLWFSYQTNPT